MGIDLDRFEGDSARFVGDGGAWSGAGDPGLGEQARERREKIRGAPRASHQHRRPHQADRVPQGPRQEKILEDAGSSSQTGLPGSRQPLRQQAEPSPGPQRQHPGPDRLVFHERNNHAIFPARSLVGQNHLFRSSYQPLLSHFPVSGFTGRQPDWGPAGYVTYKAPIRAAWWSWREEFLNTFSVVEGLSVLKEQVRGSTRMG
jgi:hypothetical protein